jgi:agmatinase
MPSTHRSPRAPARRASGFLYWEVLEFLEGLARRGEVVGIDLVEVAPAYDPAGITAILAAQILLNFLGFIFHERSRRAGADLDRSGAS